MTAEAKLALSDELLRLFSEREDLSPNRYYYAKDFTVALSRHAELAVKTDAEKLSRLRTIAEALFENGWLEAYENASNSGLFRITAKGQHRAARLEIISPAAQPIKLPTAISAAAWTGLPSDFELGEERRSRLVALLGKATKDVEILDLSNSEKSQVRSYIVASQILAEAPEPPSDLIWEMINRANSLSGVASLFVSILALFVSAAN